MNIRSADISNILATGEVFIAGAGMGTGDVSLGGGSATDGAFDLNMLSRESNCHRFNRGEGGQRNR